ncbi:MAG TPA: hypothetical protein PKJ15_04865 [Methanomassiliicoccales archaeon]|nr:MAG: hypothetical protein A4E30_01438 [Methanomassiliicoccales archaeon PtaB.Bin215]HNU35909.1 hypothetical protein [Methanomassiliicoccales archaeon]
MRKVRCKTCGRTFSAPTKEEAEAMLKRHRVQDIMGEATLQRSRYGSDA